MAFVHTTRVINDTQDIYASLSPLISELSFRDVGRYKGKILDTIYKDAVLKSQDRKFFGNFELYNMYHHALADYFPLCSEYPVVIFTTGVSADLTDPGSGLPRKVGTDPFTESFALTTRILEKYHQNPAIYERVLMVPVSPVIWPFTFFEGKIHHFRKDLPNHVTRIMECKGKKGFESLEKSLDSNGNANYQFYEESFDIERRLYQARRNTIDYENLDSFEQLKLILGHEVFLNNLIMANVYSRVVSSLKEVRLFAMQTSYATKIMIKACRDKNIPLNMIGGSDGCMRNTESSPQGECDPSAIRLLNGYLTSLHSFRNKKLPGRILDKRLEKKSNFN